MKNEQLNEKKQDTFGILLVRAAAGTFVLDFTLTIIAFSYLCIRGTFFLIVRFFIVTRTTPPISGREPVLIFTIVRTVTLVYVLVYNLNIHYPDY
ncbi:hypothetical protein NQ318_021764, partial [Aromia moschata]